MPTYIIAGKKIYAETDLTDAQLDEVSAHSAGTPIVATTPSPEALPAENKGYTSSAGGYVTEGLKALRNAAGGFVEAAGKGMTSAGQISGLASSEDSAARREAITAGLQSGIGYEPEGMGSAPGRFVGAAALTAGIPAGLAKGLAKIPGVNALAPAALNYLTPALESAGFGNALTLGQRALGGAVTGATTGAIISDEPGMEAVTGAALGGALPLIGPGAKALVAQVAAPVARRAYGIVEPFFEKGGKAAEARIIRNVFSGDEAKMQQAVDMLDQGKTIKEIAVFLNNPSLAGIAQAAQRVPHADIVGAYAEKAGKANVAAVNQLSGAQTFATKAANDARSAQVSESARELPARDMEELGTTMREAAQVVRAAARVKTKAAYDAVDDLGKNLPPVKAPEIFKQANNIISATNFNTDQVPKLAEVLSRINARTTVASVAAQQAANANRLDVFAWAPIKKVVPPLYFKDLTSILKAIKSDIRSVSANPVLQEKAFHLGNLQRSVEKFIDDAPEGVIPQELKDSLANANAVYKSEHVRKFATGKTQRNMLLNKNNEPVIDNEKVVANFFKPDGATAARRFVDMLGDNPVAIETMQKGILETFRRDVVKDGAVDQKAAAAFSEKYGGSLKILEESGVDVSAIKRLEASSQTAGKESDSATSLADDAKRLQAKYSADPDKVVETIVQSMPEAKAIVEKFRRDLAKGNAFDELVGKDTVGSELLKVDPIGVLPPGFDLTTRIFNSAISRLFGAASEKQVRDIAIALINETSTKELIKRSMQASPSGYARTGDRIKKALSSRPPPRMNELAPSVSPPSRINQLIQPVVGP